VRSSCTRDKRECKTKRPEAVRNRTGTGLERGKEKTERKRRTERKEEGDLDESEGRKKEEKELPMRRRRACV